MTTDDTIAALVSIVGGYLEQRDEGESFTEFTRRKSDDELRQIAELSRV